METKLVPGKAPRLNDEVILSALKKKARDGGGKAMLLGIRNEAGEIYRVVKAEGLGEFMSFVSFMSEKIGLVDELKDATGMKDGCDAIFS